MSTQDPTSYPYVPEQEFNPIPGPPPIVPASWYNDTADYLGDLYGAILGQKGALSSDEFLILVNPPPPAPPSPHGAGDFFGESLIIDTATNCTAADFSPDTVGGHGVWRITVATAAGFNFIARDAERWIGSGKRFLWCARVRVGARLRLDGVTDPPIMMPPPQSQGAVIGMGPRETSMPSFITGNNKATWQAWANATLSDTGVLLLDNTWYWLFIGRDSGGTIRWYIQSPTDSGPVLVHTQTWNTPMTGCQRYLQVSDDNNAAHKGDFFDVDKFACWAER